MYIKSSLYLLFTFFAQYLIAFLGHVSPRFIVRLLVYVILTVQPEKTQQMVEISCLHH